MSEWIALLRRVLKLAETLEAAGALEGLDQDPTAALPGLALALGLEEGETQEASLAEKARETRRIGEMLARM